MFYISIIGNVWGFFVCMCLFLLYVHLKKNPVKQKHHMMQWISLNTSFVKKRRGNVSCALADVNGIQMNICTSWSFTRAMHSSVSFWRQEWGNWKCIIKVINLYEADEELMMYVGFALCLGSYVVFCTFYL